METFKYRVIGQNRIKHSFIDEEGVRQEMRAKEGDVIELTKQQALNLRWQLEPLDERGKLDMPGDVVGRLKGLQAHEKLSILEEEEAALLARLEAVQKEKKTAAEQAEQRAQAKRERMAEQAKAQAASAKTTEPPREGKRA